MSDAPQQLSDNVPPPRNRLAKQMALSALANLAPPAAGFAVAPLLAQALGAEQRGIAAAATSPLLLMTTLAMFGIPEAVTYLIARNPASAKEAMRKGLLLLCGTGALASLAVFLLAAPLSGGNRAAEDLIKIAALFVLPTTLVAGLRSLPRGLHEWKYVNLEKYLTSAFRLCFIGGAFALGSLSPLAAVLILSIAPVVAGFAFLKPLLALGQHKNQTVVPYKDMTSFSLVVWLGSVSGIILGKIDQAIMLPLSDARQLGYYAAAASVADAVLVINNAVRDITFSAQTSDSDPHVLQRSARVSFLAGLMICAVLLLPVSYWFPLLFSNDFRHAVPAVVILTIAAVIGIPGSIAGAGIVGRGRPGAVSTSLVVAAVINVVAVVALVPSLGATGAAVSTLVGNFVAANLNILILKRSYGMPFASFYAIRRSDLASIFFLAAGFVKPRRKGRIV
ncbi:oligosaccharide flippase family protein [Pseudarthrobacter sp. BRE9]|uniref:oligosaccharide flippase family protein n=1 Tax=Pseudarthrobacter sp. BRE9 TaxID=2962582 RepID=UPI002882869F|nr:oligosaccharide flippase family protein [Pseudarthrobacter sp. BRE9]MDT0168123.1 oligosaccharide flippase family protein [Pseudarthrobacter sp. BRE9]